MRQIGTLYGGNIVVEMTATEWLAITCDTKRLYALPKVCRDYRKKNQMSQTALAKRAGISRAYLWRIEQGKANVSMKIYRRLMAIVFQDEEVPFEG